MPDTKVTIREEYAAALGAWLSEQSEAALMRAGALGRQAIADGLGVLDMAAIHHDGLAAVLPQAAGSGEIGAAVDSSSLFFSEALSPFEMTHRGFKEISSSITRVLQFAAVACHELRTPLTSLMNSVGMLAEIIDARPSAPEGRLMSNIGVSIDILKTRTDDLLDLVGFQSGTLTLRPGRVDVAALLTGVVERSAPGRRDVEVQLTVTGTLPPVTADPARLEQVMSNLIQNALKYGAEGKKVDVRASAAGDSVYIEVQDYGPGVSLWDRMKVWQLNYRAPAISHDIPGLGIGLALCKEIVQQHHGVITLESKEGKGSIFRVELPVHGAVGKGGGQREGTGYRGRR